jgi:hypothetical protein
MLAKASADTVAHVERGLVGAEAHVPHDRPSSSRNCMAWGFAP